MSKTKFNLELLNEISAKYAFTLIGEYDELTCQSKIKGSCSTPECEGIFEKTFHKLFQNSSSFCNKCMKKRMFDKKEQTNLIKYGTKSPSQNKNVKKKISNSHLNKTNLEKAKIEEKREATSMKRFGVKAPSQNLDVKKKISTIHLNKTDDEKKESRQKVEHTNMQRYGVKAPAQNPEIAEKCSKNAFKLKPYVLPSGKIINLQGYEHYCIDDLIKKENIDENDILNERTDVPEIWYKDQDNIERRHFVDFFIKSLNKMIEVKSNWTLDKKLDKVFLKQKAAKQLGYDYEIRVYSEKGTLLKTYS